jgi:hypothetical protein
MLYIAMRVKPRRHRDAHLNAVTALCAAKAPPAVGAGPLLYSARGLIS